MVVSLDSVNKLCSFFGTTPDHLDLVVAHTGTLYFPTNKDHLSMYYSKHESDSVRKHITDWIDSIERSYGDNDYLEVNKNPSTAAIYYGGDAISAIVDPFKDCGIRIDDCDIRVDAGNAKPHF